LFKSVRIVGVGETDVERTREDGKASSVHFAHFRFTPEQKRAFSDAGAPLLVGVDHPSYAHMAQISPATRAELAKDFA
jgi:hypothetical protein